MARSDRLFRLLQALRTLPQPVTAARLAQETEVSERTLYRDIETLRSGGALIDGAPGYGYTLTEDPSLPPQTFDRMEIEALVTGLADAGQRGDAELAAAARSALAKIAATLPERLQRDILHATHRVYRFSAPAAEVRDIGLFRRACWDEVALDIAYVDRAEAETRRRVLPLSIVYVDHDVALLAWCKLRKDFRKFLLSRVSAVEVTDESFRPERSRLLREYLAVLYGE
ncbi:HTH domain-containing protein [Rhodobacterales bacterium HKCCE4037]|nr:HTH domain-containing protein [Rhodobacterales bacterium HKCCE4037]